MQNHHEVQKIIGEHPVICEVCEQALRVAQSDLTVNVTGETGTGKGLIAKMLHEHSGRKGKPFVAVDCGLLACETARSELFGHVRGAFTSAQTTHRGMVAQAHGGTLFLDEVGELSLELQLQLLRLIEEGEFRPLGATQVEQVDVRLITATHRDLESLVAGGKFREDLYYRIQMVAIKMPPLRDRLSDIPMLISHFCKRHPTLGKNTQFSAPALDALMAYTWPGNVRELYNEILRVLIFADGASVRAEDLDRRILSGECKPDVYDLPLKEARKLNQMDFIAEYIHRQLVRSNGNVTLAAMQSGVGRQYFQTRMAECGLNAKAYRRKVVAP